MERFKTEADCIKHLEAIRWGGNVVSPFDAESTVYKAKDNRYKCRNTNKYFNVRTGTIFGDSKIPLRKWFIALELLPNICSITLTDLSRELKSSYKTAAFIKERLLYAVKYSAVPHKAPKLYAQSYANN